MMYTKYMLYMVRSALLLPLGLLMASACSTPTGPTATSVTGAVSGLVVTRGSGITVEAQRADGVSRVTTADAHGQYTFEHLDPGVYRVFASAPGYSRSTNSGTLEVVAGQRLTADRIVLNWTGIGVPDAALTGIVTDAVTGLPVEGVFLNVACDPGEIICIGRSAFTDAQGRYTIQSIPPDFGFDLFIGKADYPNHLERGHLLSSDQVQTLNVQISK